MTRTRLAAAYVAIMFAGLLLFAALAVIAIDGALRSSLDSRLTTEANATKTFIDVHDGKVAIDADDKRQFLSVLGVASNGLVLDPSGQLLLSSTARPPAALLTAAPNIVGYFDAGRGDSAVRAYASPIVHDGIRLGTVIIWRSSGLIAQTVRGAAIAFGLGAIVIAVLALLAGNLVTNRALGDAFARQRRFTADASHELRAPLAVIRAEADLALRKERTPADYQAAMQNIASEADRMEALIGDLLSAARAESARREPERVDLATVVVNVSERLAPTLEAKRGALDVQTPQSAYVLADAGALERAVMAVGHNAARYVPEGGHVRMNLSKNGRWIEVDVEDDGPGFSESALEHAFDRFWRGGVDGQEGSGLGLAIAKSIIEAYGGRISLANRGGGGAQVRIHLPAAG